MGSCYQRVTAEGIIMKNITIKRVYLPAEKSDGYRILIDRLWPRGLTKAKASIDLWLKEVAPSTELRKWFNHDPEKWTEFKKKYYKELSQNKDALNVIIEKSKTHNVTLVFGSKEEKYNDAVALKEYLAKLK